MRCRIFHKIRGWEIQDEYIGRSTENVLLKKRSFNAGAGDESEKHKKHEIVDTCA